MNKENSKWNAFTQSGAIQDYMSYKSSLSNSVTHSQGESENAHKDGRSGNQRTEYR